MAKQVHISEDLFIRLCRYHLVEDNSQEEAIKHGLSEKLEAITRRELYSKAVKGDEAARQEYLDRVGISEAFRW